MAVFIFKDASVVVNSVDLSDHVRAATINYEGEVVLTTTMGAIGQTKVVGLLNGSIEVEFAQDFAASKVDATLFPLMGAVNFNVVIKPTSGAVSATNPSFTASCMLASYPPLAGNVGDLATTKVKFEVSGVITRATS